jgi:hypothetical protein
MVVRHNGRGSLDSLPDISVFFHELGALPDAVLDSTDSAIIVESRWLGHGCRDFQTG